MSSMASDIIIKRTLLLATGSQDDYISLYDVYRGICLVQYQAHTSWPTSLAFLSQPEANLLISVGEDRSAIVWRLSERVRCCNKNEEEIVESRGQAMELVANVQIDIDPIASLSIGDTDNGPIMSTISRSGRLKIWHLQIH
ncbi:hypothetical protein BVRB_032200 [Beta vulgaris subsp. vulgaris]|uniref:Uncharacterized protein n=1 Tax=Beta vulgaris subsp. vulgaris TaxID=3555 RepID=A0A0J8B0E9_BETVV|nr:hypothetical protein BVRB_032200 [Beta vulgaris subsp. vulgaris]